MAEEQTLVSQVLQEYRNNPEYDRKELRDLRKFLRQPLVGASIQQLRKALQYFSTTGEVSPLIEAVRNLYQHQAELVIIGSGDKKPVNRIKREDLRLMCYEYVYD